VGTLTERIAVSPVAIDDEPLKAVKAVPRVLVFDEGTGLGWAVSVLLRSEDFVVERSATPRELVEMTESRRPAAIVLPLSDVIGTEALCRELRRAFADAFIVVVSPAVGEIVLRPLEAGADDFVTFPAMTSELLTRIRAGLRRSRASRQPDNRDGSQAGALEIVLDEHRVRAGDRTFELTRTEFRLLAELASAPGRVFTRDVLLAAVWGYEYIGNGRLVDAHIWRLRRKLEAVARDHIATVRGFGYKFVP
jgi:DNA-binding response OmpR family regulator